MGYVKDMLEAEARKEKELEELLNNENIQKTVIRSHCYLTDDAIWALKGTKAIILEYMTNKDKEFNNRKSWGELLLSAKVKPTTVRVTTWSSLIRRAIEVLSKQLNEASQLVGTDVFKDVFEKCLNDLLDRQEIRLNSNCPRRLYKISEEPELIHSSVYMNNKNHFIPIVVDEDGISWGLCAVYTGEIVIMLEALLDTIHTIFKDYKDNEEQDYYTFVITYIDRKDLVETAPDEETLVETVEDVNNEIQNLQLSKDLLQLQKKITIVQSMLSETYTDIQDIQKKYGLKTLDDLLNSIN